jgi:hypothetical protein
MSYGKLNYQELEEEFCYWYSKVNQRFPAKEARFSKVNLVRHIHKLKREYSKAVKLKGAIKC